MIRGYRQRRVDRIVNDAYWNGFFACLAGDESGRSGLRDGFFGAYVSTTSGYYHVNKCRSIAWKAGVEYCLEVLAKRKGGHSFFRVDRDIPGRIYAEAYGSAGIAK